MEPNDFRAQLAHQEQKYRASPKLYRWQVRSLIYLGHFYILGLLLLALGCFSCGIIFYGDNASFAAILIFFVSVVILVGWIRNLFFAIKPTHGREISAEEAPAFFRFIAKLQASQKGPEIHQILITDQFGIHIEQNPLLSLIGPCRNTLCVGLPLMQALSYEQCAALITHEYGHLSGAHSAQSSQIYHARHIWNRYLQTQGDTETWFDRIFTAFFHWLIPQFNLRSFVLVRQMEYEADHFAAQCLGAPHLAQALVVAAIQQRFIDEAFWPGLYAQADKQAKPSLLPHNTLHRVLRRQHKTNELKKWLLDALNTDTCEDTHPGLRLRLAALREKPAFPVGPHNAAQYFLQESYSKIISEFDQDWLARAAPSWRERHNKVQKAQSLLHELAQDRTSETNPRQQEQCAEALLVLGQREKAMHHFCRAADHPQGSDSSAMKAARLLLIHRDSQALHYLELAMRRNPKLIRQCSELAAEHFELLGQYDQAKECREKLIVPNNA